MARLTWEHKLEQREALRPEMPPSHQLVSDWLFDLMQRHGFRSFGQVSQHFIKCAMECLPKEHWGVIKCPSVSIFGSWFRGENGVKDTWVDSIAYVRRIEEGLPDTFSGGDVLLWIHNAPDPNAAPAPTVDDPQESRGDSIVPTEEEISGWTLGQAVTVMGRTLAHVERLTAEQNGAKHKKEKK